MRRPLQILVVVIAVAATFSGMAQQGSPLSKQASAVKLKAGQLAPGEKISVVRRHASEEYGTFVGMSAEEFTLYDVDTKSEVRLKYEEVRRIKSGYGGYNSLQHRHTDRGRALIVVVVVIGALAGLIAAAAMAAN